MKNIANADRPKSATAMLPPRPLRGSEKVAQTACNSDRREGKSCIPTLNQTFADSRILKISKFRTFRIAGRASQCAVELGFFTPGLEKYLIKWVIPRLCRGDSSSLTFTAVSLRSTLFGQEQSVEVASRHQGGRSESCRNRLEIEIMRLRKQRCYNSRLLELPMREATQVASSAALSGSHHKAPGFAGGYLLFERPLVSAPSRLWSAPWRRTEPRDARLDARPRHALAVLNERMMCPRRGNREPPPVVGRAQAA